MVRSDGVVIYENGVDCVSVAISGGGFWQLRTVANTGVCKSDTTPRYLTLDFGSPVSPTTSTTPGDLDGDDIEEQQEFAPARFVFDNAFAKKAKTGSTTPVHIYVLKVNDDGSTEQDTAWAIEYRNPAQITINPDGSRTLSLAAGAATADVWSVAIVRKREQRTFEGTYDLPFSVIAK